MNPTTQALIEKLEELVSVQKSYIVSLEESAKDFEVFLDCMKEVLTDPNHDH